MIVGAIRAAVRRYPLGSPVSPTEGVLSEAWAIYKSHWRHLLPIAFVVYVGVALISVLLVALLTWIGALLASLVAPGRHLLGARRAGQGRRRRP